MIVIKRGLSNVSNVNPLSSSNMSKAVMGDEQITLVWEAPAFVPYFIGDYIFVDGSYWTMNQLPTVKKLSSKLWQYNAIFQSTKYELLKAMYLLFDNTETLPSGEFSLTGTADTFINLLIDNMNRLSGAGTWIAGQIIQNTEYKTLTFSNEDCLTVLTRLAEEFNTEYHVNGTVIHLIKTSTERAITLQYGSTLYDIERSSVNSSDIVTRLYPFGSTKNLAVNYRGGNSPLRIPALSGNYIESNVNLYGVIEKSKTFEDVYPRLSSGGAGSVTSVGDIFTFSDSNLDFNINECMIDGVPPKIHFNTGQCAGYDFEIKSYNNTTKTFVIVSNTQENNLTLPTADIKPDVADKYVILDIAMPSAYLTAAEAELLIRAQEFIVQNSTPKVEYKTTFSAIYAKQNLQNVECGDTVTILDDDMGINESIRIIKIQKGLTDYWTIQFDLANAVSTTRIERIEGNVSTLENKVILSNKQINKNNLRSYQQSKELQEMVFDPDGYFDSSNIKPQSIETTMLSVNAKSQSFQLNTLLQPNYQANHQVLHWSAGVLTHFTILDDQIKEWSISEGSITLTGTNETAALYIYARCQRANTIADIYLDTVARKFDEGATYYYFLIGILHSPIDSVRGISLSYGMTTINGQFIKTGVISSVDGTSWFNLNTGEFKGTFKFLSGDNIEDVIAGVEAIASSADYLRAALTGSTDINGGLLATNVLLMKALSGLVTGGMSGLTTIPGTSDPDNVGLWTGGTYQDALNNSAKIILRKDGSGRLASGKISWNELGRMLIGNFDIEGGALIGYADDKNKIKLHTGAIDTLNSLVNGVVTNDPTSYSVVAEEIYTNDTGAQDTYNLTVNSFGVLTVPASTTITLHYPAVSINVLNGTVTSSDKFYRIRLGSTVIGEYTGASVVLSVGGTYTIEYVADYNVLVGPGNTCTMILSTSSAGFISYQLTTERSEIGKNGLFSFWSQTLYFYFSQLEGLKYKGAMDIPGILATCSISGDGTIAYKWGAKKPTDIQSVTKGGTGVYNVPHNIGNTDFTCMVTCRTAGYYGSVTSKTSSAVQITIKSDGGTNTDIAFDFVLIGNN